MLATLAAADALIVRPIRAPAAAAGENVPVLLLCALIADCTFHAKLRGIAEHCVNM